MGVVLIAAAAVAAATVADGGSSTEPQGPPTASPLQRQTGPATPAPGARPSVATPNPTPVIQPPPEPGQAPSGVTSYPASYFTAAQPETARDMIDRLPGFAFDNGSGVRGFEAAAGNVLIDGELPTSKGDSLDSVLRRIPASQVARIDLIRGGAPGIDMHGKVLIANVIRRTGAATSADAVVSDQWVMSDGRQVPGVRLEGTRRAAGTTLEGSLLYSDFIDDGAGDGRVTQMAPGGALQGVAQDNTEAGGYQAAATAGYERPAFGGKVRVNGSIQIEPYDNDEIVGVQGEPAIASSTEHDRQHTEQAELGFHFSRDVGRRLSLEALAIQRLNGEDYLSVYDAAGEADRFREQHTNGETIGRSVATWRPRRSLTIESGAEVAYNWQTGHTRYATNGAPVALPAADVSVNELRGEAFAKGVWSPSPKLNVELGIRVEVSHIASSGDVVLQKTLEYPKPRLFVSWSPTPRDQIRLRLEREVGQLDFNDFVAASSLSTGQILAGNPNLTPEQDWVVEAAYERSILKDGKASLTLRHTEIADAIDRAPVFSPSGVYDSPANIGGGSKDELIGVLSVPLQRFGVPGGLLKANLTWRRSSVRDPTTGEARPISGLRPYEGMVDFSQDLPRWKLTWGGDLNVGWKQPYYRYNQIETDILTPLGDLYMEVRPRPGWSIRTELDDIGIGFNRRLKNWPEVRLAGLAYADLAYRELAMGPTGYVRIRRNW